MASRTASNDSLISGFREEADKKGIRIITELETDEIMADKLSLSEALGNLLSNSLKYTDRGGRITIRSQAGPHNEIIIQVSDITCT